MATEEFDTAPSDDVRESGVAICYTIHKFYTIES